MDFKAEVKQIGLELTEEMLQQFHTYYESLLRVNSYMNLTAITEEQDVYTKHFLDSLTIGSFLEKKEPFTLCDVGSGAGFPGIPIAIVMKNARVTIIDALNKRIKFLNELISDLAISNVCAYHKRAEEYALMARETFDVVTARAVAKLNILAELCLPLVKQDGLFIAMKGQSAKEELDEAYRAIELLGGRVLEKKEFELPDNQGKRMIIVIKKVEQTPKKYPRSFAKIKERPL